jgi:hypothetical protein
VNTNYAVPHESLPIEKVSERYYMGNCMTDEEFTKVREVFLQHKNEIIELFANCRLLQKFNSSTTSRYIEDFYTILENDNLVKKWLFEKCD